MATIKIVLTDERAAALTAKAILEGLTLEEWVQRLAEEEAYAEQNSRKRVQNAAARILELQKQVKPDPEGWTVRDYINYGRR